MLAALASWTCLIAAWAALAYWLLRERKKIARSYERQLEACHAELRSVQQRLAELESQSSAANSRVPRSERGAPASRVRNEPSIDTLSLLESLADEPQVTDAAALKHAAESVSRTAPIIPDPFQADQQILPLARLADQGLSAAEIASRLKKPLGEVELLLSLR